MTKLKKPRNWSLWRMIVTFWTVLLFTMIISDFVTNNAHPDILSPVAAIYVVVLTIYSAEKEFERWHAIYQSRHPGEIYVGIWTLLIFGILVADFVLGKSYKMPSEVVSTYIVVLGVLAVTRKSKMLYKELRAMKPKDRYED